jgi:hypothetical protein
MMGVDDASVASDEESVIICPCHSLGIGRGHHDSVG